jgi:competence protein ComEA
MEASQVPYKPWMLIAIGVLFGLLSAGIILLISSPPIREPVIILPTSSPEPIWVQVSGAVAQPGVYAFGPGSRVNDALEAAGGPSDLADLNSINLAELIHDGQKISIPTLGENSSQLSLPAPFSKININTANQEELESLPGIGPQKASDILNYRQQNGSFNTLRDLLMVEGIGEKLLEQIEPFITN